MKRADSMEEADKLAQPGEYVMCHGNQNANPSWSVMTEQERQQGYNSHWITWYRKETTFHNTAKALAIYDATAPERQQIWDFVQTNADVDAAEREDSRALAKVQEAFYEDTKHINSKDHCKLVDLQFMRRMAKGD